MKRCMMAKRVMRQAAFTIVFSSVFASASHFLGNAISRNCLRNTQLKRCISKYAELNLEYTLNLNLSKHSDELGNYASDIYDPAHSRPRNIEEEDKFYEGVIEGSNRDGESVLSLRVATGDMLPQIYTRIQTQLFPQIPF